MKKEGQFFTVEDREQVKKGTEVEGDGEKKFTNDILYKPRVKTIQNIKSVLGELVACAVVNLLLFSCSISECSVLPPPARDNGVVQVREEPSHSVSPHALPVPPHLRWVSLRGSKVTLHVHTIEHYFPTSYREASAVSGHAPQPGLPD